MTKVFIYIMSVISNPDSMEGDNVPFIVDDNELFFGPCKRTLRQRLKQEYLTTHDFLTDFNNDVIYFIGLNGANKIKGRKILWVGKLRKMMTFEYAFNNLVGDKYKALRNNPFPPNTPPSGSPLLVEPMGGGLGYTKYGTLHTPFENTSDFYWYGDLTSSRKSTRGLNPKKIYSKDFELNRDACFIFENLHAAHPSNKVHTGISFSGKMIEILKKVPDFNKFAKFVSDGNLFKGRSGGYLEIKGRLADDFINAVINSKLSSTPSLTIPVKNKLSSQKC